MFKHLKKLGRNDNCPCGSGKKYKKCCLLKEAPIVSSEELGVVKMSEVLIDYASELLELAHTPTEKEQALVLAITAWNLSYMDENEQERLIANLLPMFEGDLETEDVMVSMVKMLIDKKKEEYADIDRFIIDYKISRVGGDFRLGVISTFPPKNS